MERPFDYPGRHSPYYHFTLSAPSHWASYLINGDKSGLSDDDIAACDQFYADLADDVASITTDAEPFYSANHDATPFYPFGSMCFEYNIVSKEY